MVLLPVIFIILTLMPFDTFKKVKAIPPPIITSSTLSNRFSISWILSATLPPPKIAKKGLKFLKYKYIQIRNARQIQ